MVNDLRDIVSRNSFMAVVVVLALIASVVFGSLRVQATVGQSDDVAGLCSKLGASTHLITSTDVLHSGNADGATLGPVSVSIPAGSYAVQTLSYDGHSITGGNDQDFEQWYFETFADGRWVTTSPATLDIPDDVDYVVSNLGEIYFSEDVDSLTYRHPQLQDDLWQSVYPSCISLTSLDVETPDPVDPVETAVACISLTAESTGQTNSSFAFEVETNADSDDVSYVFDFADGDGRTTDLPLIEHTYMEPGTYRVGVTVEQDGVYTDPCYAEVTVADDEGAVLGDSIVVDTGEVINLPSFDPITNEPDPQVLGANTSTSNVSANSQK